MEKRSYEGIGGCGIMLIILLLMIVIVARYLLIG